jgi:DNA-binding response OmpR family regulator
MIIEDNTSLQEIYKLNFEAADYEVIAEENGLSGISRVVDEKPDIIILDIMMPDMDGFAFLKALRENTELNIPVIVCSNLSDKETYNRALNAGATEVLLKVEYSGKQLVQKVGTVLTAWESKNKTSL